MRIGTNMASYVTCNELRKNDNALSKAFERLSSGYKINNAGDDPVGSAISKKMKAQIRGLNRANQNASDGISVVQTAEGALNEISSMVQRIRELGVQGANDTYTEDDHEAIMNEIKQLETEIDRIANDTEFNSRSLLNGDMSRNTYVATDNLIANITYVSESVEACIYSLGVTAATKSQMITAAPSATMPVDGSIKVNDLIVDVKAGESTESVMKKVVTACDKMNIKVEKNAGGGYEYESEYYGSKYEIEFSFSDEKIGDALGINGATYTKGKDAEVMANRTGDPAPNGKDHSGLSTGVIITSEGNDVTIKSSGGFEIHVSVDVPEGTAKGDTEYQVVDLYVLDSGTMTIQLGSNEAQEMEIELPEITCKTLGIDKINAYTSKGCSDAITKCDEALKYINSARSRIGAYENRLESTISSLDVTEENLTSALSRIVDVNMAEEMTEYTTQNVLTQAATSMLSQANQQPEKVLQLLQ